MYRDEQQSGQGQPTAFRVAEKKYQLHREQLFSYKKGRRRSKGYVVRPVDVSDVVDLQPGAQPPGVSHLGAPPGLPPTAAAYSFAAHPGLLVVRGALAAAAQRQLVADALTRFVEPPNHTNHSKAHPGGLPGIWDAAQQGLRLQHQAPEQQGQQQQPPQQLAQPRQQDTLSQQQEQAVKERANDLDGSSGSTSIWGAGGSGPTAASLLQKLRWATLGPPYDWTQRLYLQDVPHMPLPEQLRELAINLAALAAQLLASEDGSACSGSDVIGGSGAAEASGSAAAGQRPPAPTYCPNAALVNFYYEGDTLNGHIDDAERCLDQPLVSLSLGCSAIFLMGSHTRDAPPTPLLLRSGDAVVLSGPARRCYHGVPRVITDQAPAEALQRSNSAADGAACGRAHGGFEPFARHMERCRINISIRDTC